MLPLPPAGAAGAAGGEGPPDSLTDATLAEDTCKPAEAHTPCQRIASFERYSSPYPLSICHLDANNPCWTDPGLVSSTRCMDH